MIQTPVVTRDLGLPQAQYIFTAGLPDLPTAAPAHAHAQLQHLVSVVRSHYSSSVKTIPMPMRLRSVLKEIECGRQTEIRCVAAIDRLCKLLPRYPYAHALQAAILAAEAALSV